MKYSADQAVHFRGMYFKVCKSYLNKIDSIIQKRKEMPQGNKITDQYIPFLNTDTFLNKILPMQIQ